MTAREFLRKLSRLQKTLKDFGRNSKCTQYCYCKHQDIRSRNDDRVTRICPKIHCKYIPCVKYTHKHIILSCDIICLNKTYDEYVSRQVNTKANSYIL